MFPISWNINGANVRYFLRDNNHKGLLDHLGKLQPACILIMDGLGLARLIKNTYPDMVVIHRDFSGHEGGEWQIRSPEEFVARWEREGHHDIVRYLSNEPSFGSDNAEEFANHEARTMQLARAAGFQVVALNTGIGRFQKVDIQAGKFDSLLKAAIDYDHYLGCHEYYTVSLPAALRPVTHLLHKDKMQADNWLREPIHVGYHDNYWLLFRHVWFVKRMRDMGYTEFDYENKFILTEFGYDNIKNDQEAIKSTIQVLQDKFGMNLYNRDMRGVSSYTRFHEGSQAYWDMPFHERIIQEFEWWLDLKPNWIKGACLFTLNPNWHIPQGFDYSSQERRELLTMLEDSASRWRESPPQPEPTPQPEPLPEFTMEKKRVYSTHISGSNVRAGMNTKATVLAVIKEPQNIMISSNRYQPKDSTYFWYKVVIGNQMGYVASTANLVIENIPAPPTLPPENVDIAAIVEEKLAEYFTPKIINVPLLPDFTITIPDILRKPMADAFRAQAKLLETMAQRIENPTMTLSQLDAQIYADKGEVVDWLNTQKTLTDEIYNGDGEELDEAV